MITRFAYAYVSLLLVLQALLLISSLVLHVSVLFGTQSYFGQSGTVLFRVAIILVILGNVFTKDSIRWMDQIKACPTWMWKAALTLGVYSLIVLLLQILFPEEVSSGLPAFLVSGFPLGFEAITLCIIYSVLWSGYLTTEDIAKGAGKSLLLFLGGLVAFLAYRAGYLPHSINH